MAVTQGSLGRIYLHAGHTERAIPILSEAVGAWERMVRLAADLSPSETIKHLLASETREAKQRREVCAMQLNNLAASLGDLVNALRDAGRLDEALSTAEQGVDISRALGRDRNAVAGLGQTAHILAEQGRYQEADARLGQAVETARRVRDQELEGVALQHQGVLAYRMQRYDRAVNLYKQALRRFQDANDDANVMRTCSLLGAVELAAGRLSEARAQTELSRIYLLLGELDQAEAYAQQAREIDEGLGIIRQLPRAYYNLAQIARPRGPRGVERRAASQQERHR